MDSQQFDRFTKTVAATHSRRQLLRGALGGLAAAALATVSGRDRARAAPNPCAVFCADQPGPRKAACKQACRQCDNDPTQVCRNFETGAFTCCPAGSVCSFAGECVVPVTCPSGEPAEACAIGVSTNCGANGECALAENADGGCSCVERFCGEPVVPCTTAADCASGLCVRIPGCCDVDTFCGTPCGTTAAATRAGGGWQR